MSIGTKSHAGARPPAGRFASAALCVILLTGAAGCRAPETTERTPTVQRRPIAEVLAARTPELMALPGVVGTAEGARHGAPVIVVMIERRTPELTTRIPAALDGWPVMVEVTGPLRAMPDSTP